MNSVTVISVTVAVTVTPADCVGPTSCGKPGHRPCSRPLLHSAAAAREPPARPLLHSAAAAREPPVHRPAPRPAPPPRLGSLATLRPRPPPRPTLTAQPEPARHGRLRGGGADAASRPRHSHSARHPPPRPPHAALPEPCSSTLEPFYSREQNFCRKAARRARVCSGTPLYFHGGPPAPRHTGPGNPDRPAPPLRQTNLEAGRARQLQANNTNTPSKTFTQTNKETNKQSPSSPHPVSAPAAPPRRPRPLQQPPLRVASSILPLLAHSHSIAPYPQSPKPSYPNPRHSSSAERLLSLPPLSRVCTRSPAPRPSSLPSPAAAAPSRLRHPRSPCSFSFHPTINHSQSPTLSHAVASPAAISTRSTQLPQSPPLQLRAAVGLQHSHRRPRPDALPPPARAATRKFPTPSHSSCAP